MNDGFAPGVIEKLGFYVYLLIDPRDQTAFYVGKGTGNRCFAHLVEARKTAADTVGDYRKLQHIREVEAVDEAVQIDILHHGLTEDESIIVECAATDLLGLNLLDGRVHGHHHAELGRMPVSEVNARYGACAVTIDPSHRVVLIRINRQFTLGMNDNELYEATRKWWRIGPRRRDLDTDWAPQWAMAVYAGVVRAVYRIEKWYPPSDTDLVNHAERAARWAFQGARDPNMEVLYLYGDVTGHLRGQSPLRFVNCGSRTTKDTSANAG